MKWNGVSYIGNIARMARYCLPPVQSPVPFHPCWATPMVTKPTWASPASISLMFSAGPSVGRMDTRIPSARVRILANPSP